MPKLKTRKSFASRFKVSKNGKVMKKKAGQGHFNARDTGKQSRAKRGNVEIAQAEQRTIKANIQA